MKVWLRSEAKSEFSYRTLYILLPKKPLFSPAESFSDSFGDSREKRCTHIREAYLCGIS